MSDPVNQQQKLPEKDAQQVIHQRVRPFEEEGIRYFSPRVFERCAIGGSKRKDFKNSELNNVSGKGAEFDGFDFRYADLQDCYFHGARFTNCNFTGSKIRRCNFRAATFENCRFEYITIEETPIDYKQVVKQLPSWPNVAQEILQALRRNSVTLGEAKEIRELTLLEVDQEREHLKRARKRQEAYYCKKYGSISDQIRVRFRSLALWGSSIVWGHGEKLMNLIVSCFVFVSLLSLLSVCHIVYRNPETTVLAFVEGWWEFTKSNSFEVLGIGAAATRSQPFIVQFMLAILRIVFGGMFVAYIFRAISRR